MADFKDQLEKEAVREEKAGQKATTTTEREMKRSMRREGQHKVRQERELPPEQKNNKE